MNEYVNGFLTGIMFSFSCIFLLEWIREGELGLTSKGVRALIFWAILGIFLWIDYSAGFFHF